MSEVQAQKCVHKGCGKVFTDQEEECIYHSGPPEFHEGQKGWKCCKPRVLTFDEFLEIPPCTKGKHSTVDDTPKLAPKSVASDDVPVPTVKPIGTNGAGPTTNLPDRRPLPATAQNLGVGAASGALPQAQSPVSGRSTPHPPEDESDPEDVELREGMSCKRRACGKSRDPKTPRDDEECIYHPGVPLFHEGSKGWTCCKRRVLEFDEFMKIEGCKKRKRHCYVGKKPVRSGGSAGTAPAAEEDEEVVGNVRNDFYQTPSSVIVSFYLKKIDKERSKVVFGEEGRSVDLDLPTSDGRRFRQSVPLAGEIDAKKSSFKVLGTKLEMNLVKVDGASWSTLRSDERGTGERIQVGKAGRV